LSKRRFSQASNVFLALLVPCRTATVFPSRVTVPLGTQAKHERGGKQEEEISFFCVIWNAKRNGLLLTQLLPNGVFTFVF
jgi:hypothetical protein